MNLEEIRNEMLSRLGEITSIDNTRMNLWINLAYDDVCTAYEFPQLVRLVTFSLDSGDRVFNLPSDCYAIYSLKDTSNNKKITKTSNLKLDDLKLTTTGAPTHYARLANMIELYPTLNADTNFMLRYCRQFSLLSDDGDEPQIARNYHEAILLKATEKGFSAMFEHEKKKEAANEYVAFMRSRVYEGDIEDQDSDFAIEIHTERYY